MDRKAYSLRRAGYLLILLAFSGIGLVWAMAQPVPTLWAQPEAPDFHTAYTLDASLSVSTSYTLYMPVVMKRWPPLPDSPTGLELASEPNDTGTYQLSWASAYLATSYELAYDEDPNFNSPTQVYSGTNTSFAVSDHARGDRYYRVRAWNNWGPSGWSDTSLHIYHDDFEDVNSGWPRERVWNDFDSNGNADESWFADYQNGVYWIRIDDDDDKVLASPGVLFSGNYAIEVDVRYTKIPDGPAGYYDAWGVIFGTSAEQTQHKEAYVFWVIPKAEKYTLQRWVKKEGSMPPGWGAYNLLSASRKDLPSFVNRGVNEWNTVRIERVGDRILLYVNGQYLDQTTDSTYTGTRGFGVFGLERDLYAAEMDLEFENYWVIPLPDDYAPAVSAQAEPAIGTYEWHPIE